MVWSRNLDNFSVLMRDFKMEWMCVCNVSDHMCCLWLYHCLESWSKFCPRAMIGVLDLLVEACNVPTNETVTKNAYTLMRQLRVQTLKFVREKTNVACWVNVVRFWQRIEFSSNIFCGQLNYIVKSNFLSFLIFYG